MAADERVTRNEDAQTPVASAWRPTLCKIVQALVQKDYALARGIDGVDSVPATVADRIARCVADYGETLVDVPEDTWDTSVSQWMGDHWDVLVAFIRRNLAEAI